VNRKSKETPETCPNCGADLPPKARACPECGSDEETGWGEAAHVSGLDLPDDDFDYDEFVAKEFGDPKKKIKPHGLPWFWWFVTVALLIGIFVWVFHSFF
jgi:hypothetical protein